MSSQNDPLILTPYIISQHYEEAKQLSAVRDLPNAPQLESYSGFLTINETYNSNMFFWFFPAMCNASSAPIILWLQGGIGYSLMYDLFIDNGPFRVDENTSITFNNNTWIQDFSVIYVDNPMGSGFSFTDDVKGFSTDEETIADNLYIFIQQFFTLFNEYRNNDFYVSGVSYGAKYVTSFAYKLHTLKLVSNINFKGLSIGAGYLDPINMLDYGSFLKTMGLIDENQEQDFKNKQIEIETAINNGNYVAADVLLQTQYINFDPTYTTLFSNYTGYGNVYNILSSEPNEELSYYKNYLMDTQALEALHVGDMPFVENNSSVSLYLIEDIMRSVKPWFETLINSDEYKILLYNGNMDIITALPLFENFLKNLDWKYSQEFYSSERVIWKVLKADKEIAGYVKSYSNFNQIVIRNCGHLTSFDQPKAVFDMIYRFINSESFKQ